LIDELLPDPAPKPRGGRPPDQLAARLRGRNVCAREKGGDLVGPTKRGKGSKPMLLVDGSGLPLSVAVDSASPAEVTLIEPLLDRAVTRYAPNRLI
jgi:hypothetical protein